MTIGNSKISSLKDVIISYKEACIRIDDPVLSTAERNAADQMLDVIEKLDWVSMSQFWSFYRKEKRKWVKSNFDSQPFSNLLLRILSDPYSDVFLRFVILLERNLRIGLLLKDIKSKGCKSCWFYKASLHKKKRTRDLFMGCNLRKGLQRINSIIRKCSVLSHFDSRGLLRDMKRIKDDYPVIYRFKKRNEQRFIPFNENKKDFVASSEGQESPLPTPEERRKDTEEKVECLTNENDKGETCFFDNFVDSLRKKIDTLKELCREKEEILGVGFTNFFSQCEDFLRWVQVLSGPPSLNDRTPAISENCMDHSTAEVALDVLGENVELGGKMASHTSRDSHDYVPECENSGHKLITTQMERHSAPKDPLRRSLSLETPPSTFISNSQGERRTSDMTFPQDNSDSANSHPATCKSIPSQKLLMKKRNAFRKTCDLCLARFDRVLKYGMNTFGSSESPMQHISALKAYGIMDSIDKLHSADKVMGRCFAKAGKEYEGVTVRMMHRICDAVASTYAVEKNIPFEFSRGWLHYCLVKPILDTNEGTESQEHTSVGDENFAASPPPEHLCSFQLPKLYFSVNTCLYSSFHPPSTFASRTTSSGELDLVILEDNAGIGVVSSMDVLFIVEVKKNPADIGVAKNQRDKLFARLDALWSFSPLEVRNRTPQVASAEDKNPVQGNEIFFCFVQLQSGNSLGNLRCSRETNGKLTQTNFKNYFAVREKRMAHFLFITSLSQVEDVNSSEIVHFPSSSKLRNLLIEEYALHAANHILLSMNNPPSFSGDNDTFLALVAESASHSFLPEENGVFLSLPLKANLELRLKATDSGDQNKFQLLPSKIPNDPIRYTILLKKMELKTDDNVFAFRKSCKFLAPFPDLQLPMPSLKRATTFLDVVLELMDKNVLRSLLIC